MIEIRRIDGHDMPEIERANEGDLVFAAFSGSEMTGYCIYTLQGNSVVLRHLFEKTKDMGVADGLVRAVAAACRGGADKVVFTDGGLLEEYKSAFGITSSEVTVEELFCPKCGNKDNPSLFN